MTPAEPDDVLQNQIAYYRARAQEYDEWFYRQGRYDHGAESNAKWAAEAAILRAALHQIGPVASALEFACGTGIWTEELVKLADHVTALDAAPEVITINRGKLPHANVTYLQTDIFAWEPERQYDLIFFGFWLSHIPPGQAEDFMRKVARATAPGGHIFMIDSRRNALSGVKDQLKLQNEIYQTRELNDGRAFEIVKIYREPDDLAALFRAAGCEVDARATDQFFVYAHGRR